MPWLAARLGGLAPQVPAVTMRLPLSRVMSLDASEIDWAVRSCAQLKTLSEVTESLTFRILELEERFAEQVRTSAVAEARGGAHHPDALAPTEAPKLPLKRRREAPRIRGDFTAKLALS